MTIIETINLSKQYRKGRGIQDVNLKIEQGEVYGFLGPNGAGKTTTIRLILDLINPTGGQALLFGKPVERRRVALRQDVGYLPGELRMYERLTGKEMLDYLGRFQDNRPPSRQQELLTALDLSASDLVKPMRYYSQGMKRKIGIVQAMQHDPPLLILDEPTDGLDPLMQQNFYHLLDDYRARGGTVFMSSHVLPEVEVICDRVSLIRAGQIVTVEKVEDLHRQHVRRLKLVTVNPLDIALLDVPGISLHHQNGNETILFVTGAVSYPLLFRKLESLDLLDITFEHARLEDFFLQYYN
jgi:ABC-2 type transport system ATP-binding protein